MNENMISRLAMGVCGAMGTLAEIRLPDAILKPAIHAYSLGFGVNRDEATIPEQGFSCFGDFFARALKAGARTVCDETDAFISPCDGEIVAIQSIDRDAGNRFSVKGFNYSIDQLTGTQTDNRFAGGGGMVIYLHPRDYHRVHVPMDGQLREVRHISGARFPVAPWAEKRVDGIFQRNERMVFHFAIGGGTLILVMVAAFGVGNIATPYAPPKGAHTSSVRMFGEDHVLRKGAELGAFRLGSTVVMLWTEQLLTLAPSTASGKILLGEKLGTKS
jgi:phosphatidylserine decarboxylase